MKRSAVAAVLIALALPFPLVADDAHHKNSPATGQAAEQLSEGEVRKVDKDARKITIRHGPLKNLDMPAMTMVFQVKEPAMLDQVKSPQSDSGNAFHMGAAK
jgi:Cu/Ag efflux protein CusF